MGYVRPHIYSTLMGAGSSFSPADSTTYYFGNHAGNPLILSDFYKIYPLVKGRIKSISIIMLAGGDAGTAEDVSMYVRLNNTTDYLIQTKSVAAFERIFTNSSINVPLAETDYFNIKLVCPAWVTNPTACAFNGTIVIEAY